MFIPVFYWYLQFCDIPGVSLPLSLLPLKIFEWLDHKQEQLQNPQTQWEQLQIMK